MRSRAIECLRWIGVLPAAIGAYAGIQILVGLSSCLRVGMDVDYWSQFLCSAAGPYCLVWAGAKTAPRFRFVTALTLAIVHAVACGSIITLAMCLANSNSTSLWWALVCGAAGIVATMAACIPFRHDEEGDKRRVDEDSDHDLDQMESELSHLRHEAYLARTEEEKEILRQRLLALRSRVDARQSTTELKVENIRLEMAKHLRERAPQGYQEDLLPTFDEWMSREGCTGAKGAIRDSLLILYSEELERRYTRELGGEAWKETWGSENEDDSSIQENFDLGSVIALAEVKKGGPLTPREHADFERTVRELEQVEDRIAELQQISPAFPSEDT